MSDLFKLLNDARMAIDATKRPELYARLELAARRESIPPCKGTNCTSTDGRNHSPECEAEHDALASQGAEPVYSDNPADDNYLCPAGRAQRGLPPLASETAAGAAYEVPEWAKMDDLGGRVPSDVRMALREAFNAGRATPPAATQVPSEMGMLPGVDEIAQHIRWIGGSHKMSAGRLAEELHAWLTKALAAQKGQP